MKTGFLRRVALGMAVFTSQEQISLQAFTGASTATLLEFEWAGVFPATVILDRDGSAVFRILGEASKKALEWLLSDRSAKKPKERLKNL